MRRVLKQRSFKLSAPFVMISKLILSILKKYSPAKCVIRATEIRRLEILYPGFSDNVIRNFLFKNSFISMTVKLLNSNIKFSQRPQHQQENRRKNLAAALTMKNQ